MLPESSVLNQVVVDVLESWPRINSEIQYVTSKKIYAFSRIEQYDTD